MTAGAVGRIAHLSDCYAPRLGGIEVQVAALAGQQRDAGLEVAVLTATPGHDGVHAGQDVVAGIPVHRLAARLPYELPVHPRAFAEVSAWLRAHQVDVMHVHVGSVSPFAWSGIHAARRAGVPVLVTVHSMWGPLAQGLYRGAEAVRHWERWGAQLSAVSATAAQAVQRAVSGPVLVVPNGIDASRWRVDAVPADAAGLRVVAVLRLAPRKRAGVLVDVLQRAATELAPHARLQARIVGDGPQRLRLQRRVDAGTADIHLVGRLDQPGVRAAFAAADVFVQPSVRESFGLAALEARTAGLPIVARRQSGSVDFVRDGVEGLLAEDDAGLVDALVRLGRDPALRAAIAEHNRSVPPAQTWPLVLEAVAAGYAAAVVRAEQ